MYTFDDQWMMLASRRAVDDSYPGWDAVWEIEVPSYASEYAFFASSKADEHLNIDWGDGSSIEDVYPHLSSDYASPVTHVYSTPGLYTIKLKTTPTQQYGYFYLGEPYSWKSGTVGDCITWPKRLLKLKRHVIARYNSTRCYFANGCTGLTSAVLCQDVYIVSSYMFNGCTELETVQLPAGVQKIEEYAFNEDSSLKLSSLPDTVVSIAGYAFRGCSGLTLDKLPSGLTSIGQYGFRNASGLTLTELPETLTTIGYGAFESCSNIKLKKLPSGITSLDQRVFANCTNNALEGLPPGITSIGSNCFLTNSNIVINEFPNTVTTVASSAFMNCAKMELQEIPESVLSIADSGLSSIWQNIRRVNVVTINGTPSIAASSFSYNSALHLNVSWGVDDIDNAPWGLEQSRITYDVLPVPRGYRMLGALRSTGTQYIDLGITASPDRVCIKACVYDVASGSIFGNSAEGNSTFRLYTSGDGFIHMDMYGDSPDIRLKWNSWDIFALGRITDTTAEYSRNGEVVYTKEATAEDDYPGTYTLFGTRAGDSTVLDKLTGSIGYVDIFIDGERYDRLIPVENMDTHELGMYGVIRDQFLRNSGSGSFTAVEDMPAYIPLDYIETTGTQYIDTEECFTSTTGLYLHGRFIRMNYLAEQGVGDCGVFGESEYGLTNSRFCLFWVNTSSYLSWQLGSVAGNDGSRTDQIRENMDFTFLLDASANSVNYNGVSISLSPTKVSGNKHIFIGSLNSQSAGPLCGFMRIYDAELRISTVPIKSFIPVIRTSDNAPGLLDTVNNVFYGNRGVGSFEYYPKLPPAYKREPYLVFTGCQYFITDVFPQAPFKLKIQAETGEHNQNSMYIIGSRSDTGSDTYRFNLLYMSNTMGPYLGIGDVYPSTSTAYKSYIHKYITNVQDDGICTLSVGDTLVQTITADLTKLPVDVPISIGGLNIDGTVGNMYSGKVGIIRASSGATELMHYTPARRTPDGVYGYWDHLTARFLTDGSIYGFPGDTLRTIPFIADGLIAYHRLDGDTNDMLGNSCRLEELGQFKTIAGITALSKTQMTNGAAFRLYMNEPAHINNFTMGLWFCINASQSTTAGQFMQNVRLDDNDLIALIGGPTASGNRSMGGYLYDSTTGTTIINAKASRTNTYKEWFNITITCNANSVRTYINGSLLKNTTGSVIPDELFSQILFMYSYCGPNTYARNAYVFNKCLSRVQIMHITKLTRP